MMRQMSSGAMPAMPGVWSDGEQAVKRHGARRCPGIRSAGGGNEGRATGSKRWRQKQEEERREVTPPTTLNFDARYLARSGGPGQKV